MRKSTIIAGLTAALLLPLAACSSGTSAMPNSSAPMPMTSSSMPMTSTSASPSDQAMMQPFGPACASVPTSGAGSFDGMSKDAVATAASNNPALSTLVTAVKKAGLVDTLNNATDITVFAPTNDAFAKLPKKDLDAVLNDKAMLTKVLTNHVVAGRLDPMQLAGTHDTLAKTELKVTGSGEDFMVGDAKVVCGNVQTMNATVYIIDSVLLPKM
ncbi:MAG: fasciclin domain-containing protein [Micropruina glycogenica]|nr:fasciclin domain-containing protein [Propionibacteriaceae bacterium]